MRKEIFCFLALLAVSLTGCQSADQRSQSLDSKQQEPVALEQLENVEPVPPVFVPPTQPDCPPRSKEFIRQEKTSKESFQTCSGILFSLVIPEGYSYYVNNDYNYYHLTIKDDKDEKESYSLAISINITKEDIEEFKNRITKGRNELTIKPWRTKGYEITYERLYESLDERRRGARSMGDTWAIRSILYPVKGLWGNKTISIYQGSIYIRPQSSPEMDRIIDSFELLVPLELE
jgi:hypothetical protein